VRNRSGALRAVVVASAVGSIALAALPALAAGTARSLSGQQTTLQRFAHVPDTAQVWAVGFTGPSPYYGQTYAALFNGRRWIHVATPSPDNSDCTFTGVAATAGADAWAVGYCSSSGAFIEHWNGKRWTYSAAHVPATTTLNDVVALTRTNVWAVGGTNPSPVVQHQTVVMHFNGEKWYRVASPNPNAGSGDNQLESIAAASPTNMWAVGGYLGGLLRTGDQSLVLHFNGKKWYQVASPNPATGPQPQDPLSRVVMGPKGTTAWAVGTTSVEGALDALVLRFNGKRWVSVAVPGPTYQALNGIAVPTATSAWFVGSTANYTPLVLRWNGKRLVGMRAPASPPGFQSWLNDVAVGSSSDVYVSGIYGHNSPSSPDQLLLFHFNGKVWARQ